VSTNQATASEIPSHAWRFLRRAAFRGALCGLGTGLVVVAGFVVAGARLTGSALADAFAGFVMGIAVTPLFVLEFHLLRRDTRLRRTFVCLTVFLALGTLLSFLGVLQTVYTLEVLTSGSLEAGYNQVTQVAASQLDDPRQAISLYGSIGVALALPVFARVQGYSLGRQALVALFGTGLIAGVLTAFVTPVYPRDAWALFAVTLVMSTLFVGVLHGADALEARLWPETAPHGPTP
jgi:hypothetical protein